MRPWRSKASEEVAVLIPAYMSASFLDRTLHFARGQTHTAIRIIVSVDAGSDDSAAIAHRHAALDPRIAVHEQSDRMGWAGNVNFLIDRVETPYYFLYFHDDIVLPQYVQALLSMLQADSNAAGVYCDMGHFGASDHVSVGPAYTGGTVARLLTLLLSPQRGSPLRALLRTDKAGHLKIPDIGSGGFWANEPFLMDMISAGPLLHLDEVLYLRWNDREDGLTDGWKKLAPAVVVAGWKANIEQRLQIIERVTDRENERVALRFALFLHVFPHLQPICEDRDNDLVRSPADFHPVFAEPGTPDVLAGFGAALESFGRDRYTHCMAQGLYDDN